MQFVANSDFFALHIHCVIKKIFRVAQVHVVWVSEQLKHQHKDDRGTAVLSPLEWFPDQHGRLLQASQGWKELLWRDHCHRGKVVAPTWSKYYGLWKVLDASLDVSYFSSYPPRANTPKPTRWSYAPAPPTSRTCWIRTPPSIPSSSWRLLGICLKDLKALTPPSQDVPFAHLNAILEFMYAGEVKVLVLWRNFLFPSCLVGMITTILCNQVNVAQEQLPAFLKTAEKLKIKGLAEGTQGAD